MIALFSETLDSIAAANANYSLGNPTRILSATPLAPLFDRVSLNLSAPLKTSIVYTLTVANAKDCRGNLVATHNTAKAGWPQSCEVNNMVVNEILSIPVPTLSIMLNFTTGVIRSLTSPGFTSQIKIPAALLAQ